MKIKRYYMEDWLNNSMGVECNLSASGCQDFHLQEFLEICHVELQELNPLFLGDNSTMGTLQLRREICRSYQRLEPGEIMVTNGTSEAIFVFFNQLLAEGDEVIVPFPAFQCLYQVPISIGCRVRFLDLLACKDWKLDLEQLDHMVTPNTKLIIINNPHNPLGCTLSAEYLRRIGEIAGKNECYLFFDEHYRYLPINPQTRLIPSGYDICKPIHDKTYASGSMIKCFGMVGIRIGWLIGEMQMLTACRDYKDYLTHTIPSITDYLAYIALKNKEKIITEKKKHILRNIKLLNQLMEEHSDVFQYREPGGGVVCFPKLRKQEDSKFFCEALLEKHGVSLLPGSTFRAEGDLKPDAHFRLNFGIHWEIFEKALERIRNFIHQQKM